MRWLFGSSNAPSNRDICFWLSGMKPSQKNRFREIHNRAREVLFSAIGSEMYPVNSEHDGEIAYILVHLCSGRGALPHAVELFQSIKPEEWRLAQETFSSYDVASASFDFFVIMGTVTCGEIINEALEEHYDWALILANTAADRFKGTFLEPEVLRCRGIVLLALNHPSSAIDDLERALALHAELETKSGKSAPMVGIREPLEAARRLVKVAR
jgi:hypothetical protein